MVRRALFVVTLVAGVLLLAAPAFAARYSW